MWDTNGVGGNDRTWMTTTCIASLHATVDWTRHKLVVVDNASCAATKKMLEYWRGVIPGMRVITLGENIGQARAINLGWESFFPLIDSKRMPTREHLVRADQDMCFREVGWADRLESVVKRDGTIGIVGLKREDIESPSPNGPPGWTQSSLKLLPHRKGKSWIVVEPVEHVLGACLLVSNALFQRIGYLYQFGVKYGCEDMLHCKRAKIAGFSSCYIYSRMDDLDADPDHTTPYQSWKDKVGAEGLKRHDEIIREYESGVRNIYHGVLDE